MPTPFHALPKSIAAPLDPPDLGGLSVEDALRLRDLSEKWSREPAALLTALLDVQEIFGHLPRVALDYVAFAWRLAPIDLYALARFHDRLHLEPPKTPRVGICSGAACAARGGAASTLFLRGAATTSGAQFEELSCQGACALGPVVSADGGPPLPLPSGVAEQLLATARPGQPLMFPPTEEIPVGTGETPVAYARIRKEGGERLEVARADGAYAALTLALEANAPDAVLKEALDAGLGGPAWTAVRQAQAESRFLVVNAYESDPGTFRDRPLLERDPHMLIEGALLAAFAVGARQGFIYVRGDLRRARLRLARALSETRDAGLLGEKILGSAFSCDLFLRPGAGGYIAREPTAMLESLEGRPPLPRLDQSLPHRLFGAPALVEEVEPLASLPAVVRQGAAWYRKLGEPGFAGTKIFSLSGAVQRPGAYELPRGTSLGTLLDEFGGGILGGKAKAILAGGGAGAFISTTEMHLALDEGPLGSAGGALGTGAIVVVGSDACMVDLAMRETRFYARESCGACDPCRLGTWAMVREAEADLGGREGRILEVAAAMKDTSRCFLGRVASGPLVSVLKRFPAEAQAHARKKCSCFGPPPRRLPATPPRDEETVEKAWMESEP